MDGVLDELLRLEGAKHHALIEIDPAAYEHSVREQTLLLGDSRLSGEGQNNPEKLLAFSKLAHLNTSLYKNLLTTTPWLNAASGGYTDSGHVAVVPERRTFSAEA